MSRTWPAFYCAVVVLLIAPSSVIAAIDSLVFERCQIRSDSIIRDAECAKLPRAENPNKPDGKKVSLFVAKFPAYKPRPAGDAFVIIEGGPGGSSVDLYLNMGSVFDEIRKTRDVLVVDQRGTGRSNKLECPEPEGDLKVLWNDPDTLSAYMQECAESLDADLTAYTTSVAVQDLEAVRIAAGYEQLTIYGVSYGSRVAQHYLRRFPDSVRAMIIDGIVPVGLTLTGAEVAKRSQDALAALFKRCNESAPCIQTFGDLERKFEQLRERLKKEPQAVRFQHPSSAEWIEGLMTDDELITAVRLMPYSSDQLSLLPFFIDQAHAENYIPLLAWATLANNSLQRGLAVGMSNAVTCSEDYPNFKQEDMQGLEDTYMGLDVVKNSLLACEYWPSGLVDDDFHEPFDSVKPVLVLSGENDPITPPANGARAHSMLSNSLHIEVPAHGHGVITKGCMPQLAAEFVEQASLESLNASCADREIDTPFFFDTVGPKP